MKELIIILPGLHFSQYYDLFYTLAFFVSFLILVYEGYKMKISKFQWLQWFLVIASVRIFFIAGTKLGTYNGSDWIYFFHTFHFPATNSKTVLGGIILALLGFAISKFWLRYDFKFLNAFGIALPIGMAIQRVGCLLVGCCFGTQTELPWAFHYGEFSPTYINQIIYGVIEPNASNSLGVHPIPLYIILYCILIAIVVHKLKSRFKASGSLLILSVMLLLTARFFVEFLRDAHSNVSFGTEFFGIKVIQWILLTITMILVFFLISRERRYLPKPEKSYNSKQNYLSCLIYILFLSTLIYIGHNWYGTVEIINLFFIILSASIVLLWQLFQQLVQLSYKLTALSIILISITLMSQNAERKNPAEKSKEFISEGWNTIGFGYGGGNYQDVDYGCNGEITDIRKARYRTGRIEYNHYFREKKGQLGNFGIRLNYGNNSIDNTYDYTSWETKIKSISPYIKYDWSKFGMGLGLNYGTFLYDNTDIISDTKETLPMVFLRFGSLDNFYSELYVMDYSQLYTPVSLVRVGIGVNLGNEFSSLHAGYCDIYGQGGMYITSRFLLNEKFIFEPNLSFQLGDGKGFQGGFGVHYIFGKSSKKTDR